MQKSKSNYACLGRGTIKVQDVYKTQIENENVTSKLFSLTATKFLKIYYTCGLSHSNKFIKSSLIFTLNRPVSSSVLSQQTKFC